MYGGVPELEDGRGDQYAAAACAKRCNAVNDVVMTSARRCTKNKRPIVALIWKFMLMVEVVFLGVWIALVVRMGAPEAGLVSSDECTSLAAIAQANISSEMLWLGRCIDVEDVRELLSESTGLDPYDFSFRAAYAWETDDDRKEAAELFSSTSGCFDDSARSLNVALQLIWVPLLVFLTCASLAARSRTRAARVFRAKLVAKVLKEHVWPPTRQPKRRRAGCRACLTSGREKDWLELDILMAEFYEKPNSVTLDSVRRQYFYLHANADSSISMTPPAEVGADAHLAEADKLWAVLDIVQEELERVKNQEQNAPWSCNQWWGQTDAVYAEETSRSSGERIRSFLSEQQWVKSSPLPPSQASNVGADYDLYSESVRGHISRSRCEKRFWILLSFFGVALSMGISIVEIVRAHAPAGGQGAPDPLVIPACPRLSDAPAAAHVMFGGQCEPWIEIQAVLRVIEDAGGLLDQGGDLASAVASATDLLEYLPPLQRLFSQMKECAARSPSVRSGAGAKLGAFVLLLVSLFATTTSSRSSARPYSGRGNNSAPFNGNPRSPEEDHPSHRRGGVDPDDSESSYGSRSSESSASGDADERESSNGSRSRESSTSGDADDRESSNGSRSRGSSASDVTGDRESSSSRSRGSSASGDIDDRESSGSRSRGSSASGDSDHEDGDIPARPESELNDIAATFDDSWCEKHLRDRGPRQTVCPEHGNSLRTHPEERLLFCRDCPIYFPLPLTKTRFCKLVAKLYNCTEIMERRDSGFAELADGDKLTWREVWDHVRRQGGGDKAGAWSEQPRQRGHVDAKTKLIKIAICKTLAAFRGGQMQPISIASYNLCCPDALKNPNSADPEDPNHQAFPWISKGDTNHTRPVEIIGIIHGDVSSRTPGQREDEEFEDTEVEKALNAKLPNWWSEGESLESADPMLDELQADRDGNIIELAYLAFCAKNAEKPTRAANLRGKTYWPFSLYHLKRHLDADLFAMVEAKVEAAQPRLREDELAEAELAEAELAEADLLRQMSDRDNAPGRAIAN